jgi:hypothetical protein
MEAPDGTIEKMEAQIIEWGTRIERLIARVETAGEHVRDDFRKRVEDLKSQRAAAQSRFDDFKAAGTESWEAFRTGMEGAWKDLESGLRAIHDQDPWPKPAPKAGGHPVPRTPPVPRSTLVKQPARHRGNNR